MGSELTELERVKLENFTLRYHFMQQQLQQLQAERTAYLREVEAAHPGYEWSEGEGLVAKESGELREV